MLLLCHHHSILDFAVKNILDQYHLFTHKTLPYGQRCLCDYCCLRTLAATTAERTSSYQITDTATDAFPPLLMVSADITVTTGFGFAGHRLLTTRVYVQGERCTARPCSPSGSSRASKRAPGTPSGARWATWHLKAG